MITWQKYLEAMDMNNVRINGVRANDKVDLENLKRLAAAYPSGKGKGELTLDDVIDLMKHGSYPYHSFVKWAKENGHGGTFPLSFLIPEYEKTLRSF